MVSGKFSWKATVRVCILHDWEIAGKLQKTTFMIIYVHLNSVHHFDFQPGPQGDLTKKENYVLER